MAASTSQAEAQVDVFGGDTPEARRLREIDSAYAAATRRRNLYTLLMVVLCVLVIGSGFRAAEEANSGTFWGGITSFFDYPIDLISEAIEYGPAWFGLLWTYFPALIETINIAIVSTLIGFAGAVLLSFVASRNLVGNRYIVWSMRRIMDVTRAFPELVLALLVVLVTGPKAIAAVFAITFHGIGAMAKLFSEVNENIDMRPLDGLQSAGANWVERMRFAVLPTVLPNFLSYGLLRLEINVRASAIIGFVGAGGLGQALKENIDWKHGADVTAIMVLLIGTIILIDTVSTRLRQRLTGGSGVI